MPFIFVTLFSDIGQRFRLISLYPPIEPHRLRTGLHVPLINLANFDSFNVAVHCRKYNLVYLIHYNNVFENEEIYLSGNSING